MRALAGFMLVLFLIVLAGPALACPVCFSAKGATLDAFRFSTAFLTLVPLIGFSSFIYWYYRQTKKQND